MRGRPGSASPRWRRWFGPGLDQAVWSTGGGKHRMDPDPASTQAELPGPDPDADSAPKSTAQASFLSPSSSVKPSAGLPVALEPA